MVGWTVDRLEVMETILVPTRQLLGSGFKMDHEQPSDPHTGRKMSDMHGNHDLHAGQSVAMFRDKFG